MSTTIKTTIYDILGYLLPGLLCLGCLFAGYNQVVYRIGIAEAAGWCQSEVGSYGYLAILAVAYILGHLISALSSLTLEEKVLLKCDNLSMYRDEKEIVGDKIYERYSELFRERFEVEINEDAKPSFRLCVTFVESKQPAVYSTAFVFLSFYGMARNLAFLAFAFGLWEIICTVIWTRQWTDIWYCLFILLVGVGFWKQYLRFYKYFREYILNAFVLPIDTQPPSK